MARSSDEVAKELAEKTYRDLGLDSKTGKPLKSPKTSSGSPKISLKSLSPAVEKTLRQSPKGKSYRFSAVYRNGVVLQLLVKKFTSSLDRKKCYRFISQLEAAIRSFVANIREGYKRPTTKECLDFYGYAHASLEEVRGDIEDARDDGLLPSRPGSSLRDLGIELRPTPYNPLRSPKISYDPLRDLKRVIGEIKSEELTYEIFIELINKTDYLTRRAVEGLQEKMARDEERKKRLAARAWERKHTD